MHWTQALAGLTVGFTIGLTGVGGGSLMTPILIFLFGYPPATAVGTDLLFAAVTKTGGGIANALRQNVDWRVVGRLAAGSVPASLLTLLALTHIRPHAHAFGSIISITLGVSLLLTATALLARERVLGWRSHLAGRAGWRPEYWTTGVGVVLGVLVTMTSVGAGALGSVALFFLYPALPAKKLIGTDIMHAVPLAAVAGFGHLHMGTVDFQLLLSLLTGSLPGIWLGTRVASHLPDAVLRRFLALLLAAIGLRFVL